MLSSLLPCAGVRGESAFGRCRRAVGPAGRVFVSARGPAIELDGVVCSTTCLSATAVYCRTVHGRGLLAPRRGLSLSLSLCFSILLLCFLCFCLLFSLFSLCLYLSLSVGLSLFCAYCYLCSIRTCLFCHSFHLFFYGPIE